MMPTIPVFPILVLLSLFWIGFSNSAEQQEQEPWQGCDVFLAPSTIGWGVFAARAFDPGEIVDVAPLFLPVEQGSSIIQKTALDNYIYGYWRWTGKELLKLDVIILGTGMFYNHHTEHNLEYTTLSREPAPDVPHASNALGFVANRHIQAGEELYSSYGKDDGGKEWFTLRGVDMQVKKQKECRISNQELPKKREAYCSNIYAGMGWPTWKAGVLSVLPPPDKLPFWTDGTRFAPKNAGVGNAFAKRSMSIGERIEIAPGMVMSRKFVDGTALAPIVFGWEDLNVHQRAALRILREDGLLTLQFQNHSTDRNRVDGFKSFEDTVIFPVAGTIGMLRRVGGDGDFGDSNCRLEIHPNLKEGGVGVTLEVIASENIEAGDILKLDMPPRGSWEEVEEFLKMLKITGQPYDDGSIAQEQKQEQNDEL
jgi:hypothetical protein